MNQPNVSSKNSLTSSETKLPQSQVDFTVGELNLDRTDQKDESLEKTDYPAWESQMAKLVGLEEASLSNTVDAKSLTRTSDITEEEKTPPKQQLSSNPFAKLGLVSSATLLVAMLVGIFLSQITNIGQAKPSQDELIATPELPEQTPTESQVEDLQGEVEVLKTKLALARQIEAVKVAQQTLKQDPQKPLPTVTKTIPKEPTSLKVPTPRPPVTPPVSEPRIVYVERSAPPKPVTPPQETKKLDPQKEWMRLAKLGSYGQVSATSDPVRSYQARNSIPNPQSTPSTQQTKSPDSNLRLSPQVKPLPDRVATRSTLPRQDRKFVAIGSTAKAVLATAVYAETNNAQDSNQEEPVFVANLQEPLKAANGEIALPVDTKLLLQVSSLSDRGLMRLKVVKVITENNGSSSEKSLPANAIAINAPQGKPLLAEKYSNKSGSIAFKDAQLFLLGGLGRAAEIHNRTESEVVTINGGSTVVSSNSADKDLLAGAVQGGIETLAPKLAQRNEQQIAKMLQRSNVWLISAGTKIELYVNKDIQL